MKGSTRPSKQCSLASGVTWTISMAEFLYNADYNLPESNLELSDAEYHIHIYGLGEKYRIGQLKKKPSRWASVFRWG